MMRREALKGLLQEVKRGGVTVSQALEKLKKLPYEEMGFAVLDHHRAIRQGIPEVIYCEGKSPAQVVQIVRRMKAAGSDILATRADAALHKEVRIVDPRAEYNESARTIVIRAEKRRKKNSGKGHVLIITAGTADIPVAEEAGVTARFLGSRTSALYDVGVAGIHRLMDKQELIEEARVIIVVAGMDGALPSVVGGLTEHPLVAVPTSQGYGVGLGGFSALFTMLNSCAAGVGVVNIDNGFGAACLAHRINMLGSG